MKENEDDWYDITISIKRHREIWRSPEKLMEKILVDELAKEIDRQILRELMAMGDMDIENLE